MNAKPPEEHQLDEDGAIEPIPVKLPPPVHSDSFPDPIVYTEKGVRNVRTTENDPPSLCEKIVCFFAYVLFVITVPFCFFFYIIVLQEFQRAVILRLGRLRKGGARGPGMVLVIPCIDAYRRVDLRTTSFDVPPQEILTKDSVTIKVDAVVYYSVRNPLDAVLQVANAREATRLLAMTTLRNVSGMHMLMELLTSKESLSKQIEWILDGATEAWGVRVERVEIKEIYMPAQLQRAMAVEQEAAREARAKVAAAEGERDAVKSLREAADIMMTNPIALQLRYLQTLNTISNNQTRSYVFPFPVDIVKKWMGK
ncbi:band 7 protein AGAP004871-like [Scaptodrosophila lebanonensis]|uniref:Band 7 protein AGAP004871-like n=1 Tax=Drosophila lebanonensis TaxID=7225 RepID=A0A6J2TPR3_DROLE|nr:band 7 protein AGAP004871-like [Scaptodrosophila lebanonensis]